MKLLNSLPIQILIVIFSICLLLISQALWPKAGVLGSLESYISHLLKSIVVMIWGVIVIKIGVDRESAAIVFGLLIFIIGMLFFVDSILGILLHYEIINITFNWLGGLFAGHWAFEENNHKFILSKTIT